MLDQDLYFNNILKWYVCILKVEKLCSRFQRQNNRGQVLLFRLSKSLQKWSNSIECSYPYTIDRGNRGRGVSVNYHQRHWEVVLSAKDGLLSRERRGAPRESVMIEVVLTIKEQLHLNPSWIFIYFQNLHGHPGTFLGVKGNMQVLGWAQQCFPRI